MKTVAQHFMEENDKHPVIIGAAIGNGGQGGYYTLENGKSYRLSLEDCQALAEGYPKWKIRETMQ